MVRACLLLAVAATCLSGPVVAQATPDARTCPASVDAEVKAIRANAALTPAAQQAEVDALWSRCGQAVMDGVRGRISQGVDLNLQATIDAAVSGADADVAAAAATAQLDSDDPDHRETLRIVGQYERESRGAD